ncbi:ferredoxin [Candidatus Desantisbacteria bacterium CG_4_10_14_0_8_um_filter_48_22]|uniref:Ferredoxin n=1 Tax=Candidatus Desantisbacteria bacterium CG_4_10_14_0_8_um_filter_48_22 TaxID=1974543 RepID=A0A2M7S8I3_9BACT|nr:MAG: ferredoxin [Candidatus Desantisbacteria bacterium CG1_02_49_89]PIV57311.1 MAG: ferredoxin [Candidatus Desantisbacteria bacterium CG02_land_8_20_14_3_00_49_13]PIZ15817.1 MAG: ferredoxin [Candidatus Desantisbacteria bacterium CG_4_10_14_0_8_um_filter_48_22]PJB27587.1 MAG: ferredoxin [Candidatus Desantisbacteria bacterium CG_4_9_14_3_um_filter_50_7]
MISSDEAELNAIRQVANLMCAAARTAPKGRGIDNLVTAIVEGEEKNAIARKMLELAREKDVQSFARDAAGVRFAPVLVLIGTRAKPMGLKICGLCGFKDCAELEGKGGICVFNASDLGVAIGSAVSVAALHHVDNRVMYTAGIAAMEMELLGKDVKILFTIPLTATGKNPFFDRK